MPYIIKSSLTHMPKACRGAYSRVALLEVEPGVTSVKMISLRSKGVVRIVETWEKLNMGGAKSAFGKALAAAERMAAELNAQNAQNTKEVTA